MVAGIQMRPKRYMPAIAIGMKHIPIESGEIVRMDITYSHDDSSKASPAFSAVCPPTLYVMCKFAKNPNKVTLLSAFLANWGDVVTYPKLIIMDQGK